MLQRLGSSTAPCPATLHRGFAKLKDKDSRDSKNKAKKDSPQDDSQPAPVAFRLDDIRQLLERAIDHFQHQLAGVRTGRASPGLIESVTVEAYGERVPLTACGTVTVRTAQLLAVSVYDSGLTKAVEKAIRTSPLSLNPSVEGQDVLVPVPRISRDTIDKMIKLVHSEAEGAKISVRNARQKGMDGAKRAYADKDERKRAEREVQKLHDQYVQQVDKLKLLKETELREHL